MIILEAGLWLAWGILLLNWAIPAVMGIIDIARRQDDYDTMDRLGFATVMFIVWGFATAVMYGVMR